jgi:hypothetical protein
MFEARPKVIMVRVSKKEKEQMEKNAEKNDMTLSTYVRTRSCKCGEPGYEGVGMVQVDWICGKCQTKNTWRAK